MVELRQYQEECISTIYEYFKNNKKQLIQLPTGAGKTFIFLNYLKRYSYKSLIICPSLDLKEQILHWGKFFLGEKNISTNINKRAHHYVLTDRSLISETTKEFLYFKDFDHIIIDEAHHAQAPTYVEFLDYMSDKSFNLLGCTATPERLDKKCLLEIFDKLTYSKELIDLIKEGYLCDISSFRIKTGIKINNHNLNSSGDFQLLELKKLNNETRNEIILKTFLDNCSNLKTLIFCVSIDHAEQIATLLKQQGIACEAIHGNMKVKARKDILNRFNMGQIQVLTNCQLLTEGFDEPSIQALIIARPTKSKSLYFQMIGRGVRIFENKPVCYLYELTDNAHNVCSFNVAANKEPNFEFEYKQGTRLTELHEKLMHVSLQDVILNKEKLDLFNVKDHKLPCNSIDVFNSVFYKMPAFDEQVKTLKSMNIPYINHINYLEAAFLIWKEKLKVTYGIHKTNKRSI